MTQQTDKGIGNVRIFDNVDELFNYEGENRVLFRGDLEIKGRKTLKSLVEVSSSVYVYQNATFTAPKLTEVSSSVYVYQNATFTAPKLTEVDGSLNIYENATLTAPKLEKSGYVYLYKEGKLYAPLIGYN